MGIRAQDGVDRLVATPVFDREALNRADLRFPGGQIKFDRGGVQELDEQVLGRSYRRRTVSFDEDRLRFLGESHRIVRLNGELVFAAALQLAEGKRLDVGTVQGFLDHLIVAHADAL